MNKKTRIKFLMVAFTLLILVNLYFIDWSQPSFSNNKLFYLGLVSNSLLMLAMFISIKKIQKKENESTRK